MDLTQYQPTSVRPLFLHQLHDQRKHHQRNHQQSLYIQALFPLEVMTKVQSSIPQPGDGADMRKQ